MANLNRPGVFVTQTSTGGLPQPIATHAVGYIFGTTENEEYYSNNAQGYSPLLPYKPTQIASTEDFVAKSGGVIPTANAGALVTYDSIKGFFDNVGTNGILYFTRVTPTPETLVNLAASSAGSGYNAFAIKVNGRYFGTPIGINDDEGTEIKVITTTGLDQYDNARDLFLFLSASSASSDNFSDFYRVEQTATEATQAKFRIFSRDVTNLPEISNFIAYSFSGSAYSSPVNLLSYTTLYTSIKEVNFRCDSVDVGTGEAIRYVSGAQLSLFIETSNDATPGTYDPATDQSQIIKDFLVDQDIYTSAAAIPDGKILAVSLDSTSGVDPANKWRDVDAGYWVYDLSGTSFSLLVDGSDKILPSGSISGGVREGYLPKTVQVFYVNVLGENRAIIVNGSTPQELADELRDQLTALFVEKNVAEYYKIESVAYPTILTDTYTGNNGSNYSLLVSQAGAPSIRPSFEDNSYTGNEFYSFDYVLKIKITSKNGVAAPVIPGNNRFGILDTNVARLNSSSQDEGYESYKLTQIAKAQDFVYAIEEGMGSATFAPGFLFAPEAYAELVYNVDGDLQSKSEARLERVKITQSLTKVAEGNVGVTEGVTNTQYIALIDCGGDEENLPQAQDELAVIKSLVGVPYGHAAFYAPYVQNLNDRYVPASAYVAGIACSRYINEGFQQPPAGSRYPLRGAKGLKFTISAQQQEVTYALGLNPIRSLPNRGIVAWGARTLSSNSLFKFVNTRAILNVIIDVLGRSFDDILFEQIDSAGTLYSRIRSVASQVLHQFYRQGALFGGSPEQAYAIVCSTDNNSNTDLEQGTVQADIYVSTSPTLERIPITLIRTPAGQVALISDSFSRNGDRYTTSLGITSNFL
jgi:hypothetical protein